ncbi:MAG: hypothetical protein C3F11_09470, partial [Methylocystaceae bacterium]
MMSRLYPSLPLYQRESAESYVSRLACLHQSCARFFCVDFGTTIQAVITGDDSALAKIEELAGLSSGALSQWAIRRGQRTMYEIRHEKLSRASLRRERVFVCPRCLQDDVSSSPQLSYLSAHGRTIWMLASIRTCHIHGVALEEIGSCSSSKRGDIASVIQSALPV